MYKPNNSFEEKFLKQAGENLEADFIYQFLENIPRRPAIERTDKMLYSKMIVDAKKKLVLFNIGQTALENIKDTGAGRVLDKRKVGYTSEGLAEILQEITKDPA